MLTKCMLFLHFEERPRIIAKLKIKMNSSSEWSGLEPQT